MITGRARRIGAAAKQLIEPNQVGVVHSVFPKALNVGIGSAGLITLTTPESLVTPITLKTDLWGIDLTQLLLEPGMPVRFVDRDSMIVGDTLRVVRISSADVWEGCLAIGQVADRGRMINNLSLAKASLKKVGKDSGFLSILDDVTSFDERRSLGEDASPYSKHAFAHIRKLTGHILSNDVRSASLEATNLVGLGLGLTPSGDDFLCGLIVVMSISRQLGVETRSLGSFTELVNSYAERGTNEISKAYLGLHSRGLVDTSVYDFIENIVHGETTSLEKSVKRLCGYGHFSGTDVAVGILYGFEVMERIRAQSGLGN